MQADGLPLTRWLATAIGCGVLLGALLWLWSEHGASVYLGYLLGAPLFCF